jgi:bleomycin hydrolase
MLPQLRIYLIWFTLAFVAAKVGVAQEPFSFSVLVNNPATPVKDQAYSGTCWSFGTISFVESEILRNGGDKYDLSEMFIVNHIYPLKIENFVRWHGKVFLTAGGQSHDVMRIISEYGLVPEQAYSGKETKFAGHHHQRLDSIMMTIAKNVNRQRRPTNKWKQVVQVMTDLYLGAIPETFTYKEKSYSAFTFRDMTGFNPGDYVEITSYSDHPAYKTYVMDSKYNWSHDLYYNVPLKDFLEITDYALKNGYTLAWDGDVSETEFSFENAIAIVPLKSWNDKTYSERISTCKVPEAEIKVDEKLRQSAFNSGATTIDHIMHITGMAKDQKGNTYYITKNSWGEFNNNGGYLYMSKSYFMLKTVAIMIHKDAIPVKIKAKLGI